MPAVCDMTSHQYDLINILNVTAMFSVATTAGEIMMYNSVYVI